MHACARICLEVNLGKGLPEAVKINVDRWIHIQQLDYEQIPFKCKVCHEYCHCSNRCAKKQEPKEIENQEPKWEQVKKKKCASKSSFHPSSVSIHLSLTLPHISPSSSALFPIPSKYPPSPSLSLPSSTIPPPSTDILASNPFGSLVDPDLPSSPPLLPFPSNPSPFSPIISHSPPHSTFDQIITRNLSKDLVSSLDHPKQVEKKSNREIRDDVVEKEMALGTQQPLETFLEKIKEKNIHPIRGKVPLPTILSDNEYSLLEL